MSDTEIAPPEETQPAQPAEPEGPTGRVRGRGLLLGLLGGIAVVTGAAQVFGGTVVAAGTGGAAAVAGGGYAYYRHRKNAKGKKHQRTWTLKWDRRSKSGGGQHRGSGRKLLGGSGSRGRSGGGKLLGGGRGRSGSGRSGSGRSGSSASRGRFRPFGRGRPGGSAASGGSGSGRRWRLGSGKGFGRGRGRSGSGSGSSGSGSASRIGGWLRHPFSRSRRAAAGGGRAGSGGSKAGGRGGWWQRTGRRLRHPFAGGRRTPGAGGGHSRQSPPARRVSAVRRAWWRLTPNAKWAWRRPGGGKTVPRGKGQPRARTQPSAASRVARRLVPAWVRSRWAARKHHPLRAVRGWLARLRQRGQQDAQPEATPEPDPPAAQPQPGTEPVIARGPGLAPVIQMDDHRRQQEAVPTGGTKMGNPAEQLDELADEISNWMPGSGDELDAMMKQWPESLRKFGGAITSMADGWGEEHIHPAVIDSMKEHGGAVSGVGDSAEDANETHAREHHLWLAD